MASMIYSTFTRPSKDIVERYRAVWLECVVQALAGANALMAPAIKPIGGRHWTVVGPALTVVPVGTDTLTPIIATGLVQPGDVIVVAANGDCDAGVWGGGLTLSAKNMGCAGVIVDGATMDTPSILSSDIPVFCRTSMLAHAVGSKAGSINVDLVCGGVKVAPGDLIYASPDGVAVVPQGRLEDILAIAEQKTAQLLVNKSRLVPGVTLFDLRGGRPMAEAAGARWIEGSQPKGA